MPSDASLQQAADVRPSLIDHPLTAKRMNVYTTRLQTITPLLLVALLLGALAPACGWGYAAETYRPKTTAPPTGQITYVAPPKPVVEEKNPCEIDTFMVFRMDEGFRQTREMSCSTGKILSLTRADITHEEFRSQQLANVPVAQWYVLVDPVNATPADRKAISNEQLLGLSRLYQLKYYQQLANTNLIIYSFTDPTPGAAAHQ